MTAATAEGLRLSEVNQTVPKPLQRLQDCNQKEQFHIDFLDTKPQDAVSVLENQVRRKAAMYRSTWAATALDFSSCASDGLSMPATAGAE